MCGGSAAAGRAAAGPPGKGRQEKAEKAWEAGRSVRFFGPIRSAGGERAGYAVSEMQ